MRGYFGIGIYDAKHSVNIGTLWRSAYMFGASFIFTIGKRYKKQASDTYKSIRHIPLYNYSDFSNFYENMPYDCQLIGIEKTEKSTPINNFLHPQRCIYLLGAEDSGLPNLIMEKCKHTIHIDTERSLNVSVAGSIVMFDKQQKELIK
jgi:tRNA G18 (ribose-2'-O)-methylase SpoU